MKNNLVKDQSKTVSDLESIMSDSNNVLATRVSLLAICYYKSIMYCVFAVLSLYIDNKVLGTLCVFFLFLSVLFVTGVNNQFSGLLRLYQFMYVIVCSLLTTTAMIEFVKMFIENEKVDYLFFIVWFLLVLPTVFMIKLLSTYIQQISESTLLNV